MKRQHGNNHFSRMPLAILLSLLLVFTALPGCGSTGVGNSAETAAGNSKASDAGEKNFFGNSESGGSSLGENDSITDVSTISSVSDDSGGKLSGTGSDAELLSEGENTSIFGETEEGSAETAEVPAISDIPESESEADELHGILDESSSDTQEFDIPQYDGDPYEEVNENDPFFTEEEKTSQSFEIYGVQDSMGRCTAAAACIGEDLMPTEERGRIGMIKPSGWHTIKYDIVDGKYLYNRCHLIGYQLTAENANEDNLITGTRYMNVEGMLPFEDKVSEYVQDTGNHVLYRATPVFEEDNLLVSGVLLEAESIEDNTISFNVFCFNIQPGIAIDYQDGDSEELENAAQIVDGNGSDAAASSSSSETGSGTVSSSTGQSSSENEVSATYILNTNTRRFHRPDCSSVSQIKNANKESYTGSRQQLIDEGYQPCGNCKP